MRRCGPGRGQCRRRRPSVRSDRVSPALIAPQSAQVLLDGYQRSAAHSFEPYQPVLYSSWRMNSPNPASEMARARRRLRSIPATLSDSTAMARLVLASLVVNWCRKSARRWATFRWILATARTGLGPVVRTWPGSGELLVGPAQPALGRLQRPGRVDLFDRAGVVGDDRERLQPHVDAAGRRIRRHGAAGVDVGAVDVELERYPPPSGPLPHRGADDPGPAVGDAFGQPRHVLERVNLADLRQVHGAGVVGPGGVGVVAKPGAVLAFTQPREPDLRPVPFTGLGLPPALQPGRPDPARLLRHPGGQSSLAEPRIQHWVGLAPQPLQVDRRPRHRGQLIGRDAVGLFGLALGERGLDPVEAEVLHHPRQPGVAAHHGSLLDGRGQLDPEALLDAAHRVTSAASIAALAFRPADRRPYTRAHNEVRTSWSPRPGDPSPGQPSWRSCPGHSRNPNRLRGDDKQPGTTVPVCWLALRSTSLAKHAAVGLGGARRGGGGGPTDHGSAESIGDGYACRHSRWLTCASNPSSGNSCKPCGHQPPD